MGLADPTQCSMLMHGPITFLEDENVDYIYMLMLGPSTFLEDEDVTKLRYHRVELYPAIFPPPPTIPNHPPDFSDLQLWNIKHGINRICILFAH